MATLAISATIFKIFRLKDRKLLILPIPKNVRMKFGVRKLLWGYQMVMLSSF